MRNSKRVSFEVTAESQWGVERGVNAALQHIAGGRESGEFDIPKHDVFVEWTTHVVAIPTGTDIIESGSLVTEQAPEIDFPVADKVMPDISKMDIEDAKGVVGSAADLVELALLRDIEAGSERYPGGRKGVIQYIDKIEKDMVSRQEKSGESVIDAEEA